MALPWDTGQGRALCQGGQDLRGYTRRPRLVPPASCLALPPPTALVLRDLRVGTAWDLGTPRGVSAGPSPQKGALLSCTLGVPQALLPSGEGDLRVSSRWCPSALPWDTELVSMAS